MVGWLRRDEEYNTPFGRTCQGHERLSFERLTRRKTLTYIHAATHEYRRADTNGFRITAW